MDNRLHTNLPKPARTVSKYFRVFKTDKLTPLQVKACVCQQCPFPGELETKCDWCDNPKMVEFLRLALSAIDDFYQQHEANALKEQMEMVMGVIDRQRDYKPKYRRKSGITGGE